MSSGHWPMSQSGQTPDISQLLTDISVVTVCCKNVIQNGAYYIVQLQIIYFLKLL